MIADKRRWEEGGCKVSFLSTGEGTAGAFTLPPNFILHSFLATKTTVLWSEVAG